MKSHILFIYYSHSNLLFFSVKASSSSFALGNLDLAPLSCRPKNCNFLLILDKFIFTGEIFGSPQLLQVNIFVVYRGPEKILKGSGASEQMGTGPTVELFITHCFSH